MGTHTHVPPRSVRSAFVMADNSQSSYPERLPKCAGAAAVKPLPTSFAAAGAAGQSLLAVYNAHFYPVQAPVIEAGSPAGDVATEPGASPQPTPDGPS